MNIKIDVYCHLERWGATFLTIYMGYSGELKYRAIGLFSDPRSDNFGNKNSTLLDLCVIRLHL